VEEVVGVAPALTGALRLSGEFAAMAADVTRAMPRRPFQAREFVEQAWFIASVTIVPTMLVSIPFGAVISLQVGQLTGQLGAQSFAGASAVLAVVREAAPIAAALLIAGAAGSAICADLGSRTIREEIDAMEVLGVNPIARLVVPRVFGAMFVAFWLNGLVIAAGIAGGYFFHVVIQNGSAGAYLSSFTALATMPDLYVSLVKSVVFAWLAAIMGSYKGLTAGGGPKGVGQAVNESVIASFMLLFMFNAIASAIYFQVVPPRGL
jgi:phospholipid/cholesterol/gamma-HCH transport system permease protein